MVLETRQTSGLVYRLGRRPNAWQPQEWSLAHADGTFGNRFDDPAGYYRVLYASSQRVACFVETLARFRPDLALLAELTAIDGPDDFFPLGTLPREWLEVRTVGRTEIEGCYADIYAAGWVSHLRRVLAAEALRLGVKDIDLSTLQMAEPRRLTQLASREVYRSHLPGVFYGSRYGHSLANWALFEPFLLIRPASDTFSVDDADFLQALRLLGVRLQSGI